MLLSRSGLAVLALGLAAATAQAGDLTVAGPVLPYTSGLNSQRIEVADIDGDGLSDLLTSDNALRAWRNVGRGTLTPLPAFGMNGMALTADLDGDGDRAVVGIGLSGVRQQSQTAPFVFGPITQLAGDGLQPGWVGCADVDGDGRADLLAADVTKLRCWLNDGAGSVKPAVLGMNAAAGQPAMGDLDGDGDLDLVCLGGGVALGHGDGSFQPPPPPGANPQGSFALADIDEDGSLDLAAVASGLAEIYHGNGDASFDHIAAAPVLGPVCDLADADGDGDLDVLLQSAATAEISVHRIEGTQLVALPGFQSVDPGKARAKFADFDGDGRSGAVSVGGTPSIVRWVQGDGTGSLVVRQQLAQLDHLTALLAADVDGDGRPEVVGQRDADTTHELRVWAAPGDGTLTPLGLPGAVAEGELLATADFDGDARADVLRNENGWLRALRSLGDGSFAPGGLVALPQLAKFAIGDLNADGADDLVISKKFPVLPVWYPGLAGAAFGPEQPLVGANVEQAARMSFADLDGDQVQDLVMSRNVPGPASLQVLHGLGAGSFGAPLDVGSSLGAPSEALRLSDIDADGDVDIIGVADTGLVVVVRGDGQGGFAPAWAIDTPIFVGDVVAADLDGDARSDLLLVGDTGVHGLMQQAADGSFAQPRRVLVGQLALDVDNDADADLVGFAAFPLVPAATGIFLERTQPASSFLELSPGSLGPAGVPVLTGAGPLAAGSTAQLLLRGAAPNAPCQVVFGLDSQLAGKPTASFPRLTFALQTDAAGRLLFKAKWPAGLPEGFALYAQCQIADPGAVGGQVSSSIVELLGD